MIRRSALLDDVTSHAHQFISDYLLKGVLSKLPTFRMSITSIHGYRIQIHKNCQSVCIIQLLRGSTFKFTVTKVRRAIVITLALASVDKTFNLGHNL